MSPFRTLLLSLAILLGYGASAYGQLPGDRLEADIGLFSTLSSERYQGFWLVHNRWGMFDDASANGLITLSLRDGVDDSKRFDTGGGITLLGRASDHSTVYLPEAYLEAHILGLQLLGGRFMRSDGHTDPLLSSGSMGISPNATPMPRITLALPEFLEIPWTAGWLEFKAHYGHGWMDDDRYTPGTMLHEKSFYLQTGGESGVKFFAGLVHFAKWGGNSVFEGDIPQSFRDYLKVVRGREGGEDAPSGEQMNALGDHLGYWDWGLKTSIVGRELYLYYQHFYETNSGLRYRNLRDGLYGIEIGSLTRSGLVDRLVYEFTYTKHQTGPGMTDPSPQDSPSFCDPNSGNFIGEGFENPNCGYRFNGRDDYYNNDIYRTGWTYHSYVIGNPFFLTRRQLDRVDPDLEVYNSFRSIVGNRFLSHHIGVSGRFAPTFSYRSLLTYVRHYGTYRGLNFGEAWGSLDPANDPDDYFFHPPRHQWYSLFEVIYTPANLARLQVTAGASLDFGDLFNNAGVLLGMNWTLL